MKAVIEDLILQRHPLLLLDEVINSCKSWYTTKVYITEESLLCTDKGVPAWAGIEYMAQSVAAYNTSFICQEMEPQVGFIIGVRQFECDIESFPVGSELSIYVQELFIDEQSGSFDCKINLDSHPVCRARLTTYIPTHQQLVEFGEVL